jgi:hypothetical protein
LLSISSLRLSDFHHLWQVFEYVLRLSHHFQVLRSVILLVSVFVMNDFTRQKFSSNRNLGNRSMFMPSVSFNISDSSASAFYVSRDCCRALLARKPAISCAFNSIRFDVKQRSALLAFDFYFVFFSRYNSALFFSLAATIALACAFVSLRRDFCPPLRPMADR